MGCGEGLEGGGGEGQRLKVQRKEEKRLQKKDHLPDYQAIVRA